MTIRFEAESLAGVGTARGFAAQATANASGGSTIGLKRGRTGTVESKLAEAGLVDGFYKIKVAYYDETDGESFASLSLDGRTLGAWRFDGVSGVALDPGGKTGAGTQGGNRRAIEFGAVAVSDVSRLTLTASAEGGEAARIDFIELVRVFAPTDLSLTRMTVAADESGAIVGAVTVIDADAARAAAVTVDDARFEVADGVLRLRAGQSLDSAAEPTLTLAITATDSDGLSYTETVTLDVLADAPPEGDIQVRATDLGFDIGRLVFNHIERPGGRIAKSTGTVVVTNEGEGALAIRDLVIDGPFSLIDPAQDGARVLEAGESFSIGVRFDRALYDPATDPAVFSGALRIISDDADEPVAEVALSGFWSPKPEGGHEASVNETFEVFGFANRLPFGPGGRNIPTDYRFEKTVAEEVLSAYWRIADGAEAMTITRIGAFVTSDYSDFSIYNPGNNGERAETLGFTKAQHSRFLPRTTDGGEPVLEFSRDAIPDHWQGDGVFGFVSAWTHSNPYHNWGHGHGFRIFQALDADGDVIANTYLGAQDGVYGNEDFNDGIFLITGAAPAYWG